MPKRVTIGYISHESNSFSPISTPLATWQQWGLHVGDQILTEYPGSQTSVAGFLDVARQEGWEVIPTLAAQAMPSAPSDGATYAWLKERLLAPIAASQPDAVLLALHGAMMADGVPDCEGDLVAAVRALIGDRPLLVVLDLHGNLTPEMCAACDGVFGFDTNPHVDLYDRGREAADCLRRIFAGEVRPVVAMAHPRMMPPTINMLTATGPMAELFGLARQWEAQPGILNVSVFGGFPYCDVPFAGTSVVVTADADRAKAQAAAEQIASRAWELRHRFYKQLPSSSRAVRQALALLGDGDERPIILADVADNPAGGGSGETTELLRELLRQGVQGVVVGTIWDPAVVEQAAAVGVGGKATFQVGGKWRPEYGAPLTLHASVRTLTDGRFESQGPYGRGPWNMGPTAVLEAEGVRLIVTSRRIAPNVLEVFQSVGIEPAETPVIVLKSRGHFRAAFEPLARAIIEVDAPGAASVDLQRYPFRRVTRPIWPLDEI